MRADQGADRGLTSGDLTDAVIRVGLIGLVVVLCARVFAPFAGLVAWALILAIALYPLHQRIARRTGGHQGRAALAVVVAGLLLIGVPASMLVSSFAGRAHEAYTALRDDTVVIPPPSPSVASWPLVGPRLYRTWESAATDLPAYLESLGPQLKRFARSALRVAAGTAVDVLVFLGALVVAGIIMAHGEPGDRTARRIICRLAGPVRGPRLHRLSTATIRSVATGVVGVAFIQALLLGLGFTVAGIPGAGVWAFVVLLLGIAQLSALLVSLPVIAYLWWSGDASTTMNVVYTVYLLLGGFADNVLKPMLLGRGVDAPMPVILLGALGGMMWARIIGLFVGAVVLAVGYQLFMEWVEGGGEDSGRGSGEIPAGEPPARG